MFAHKGPLDDTAAAPARHPERTPLAAPPETAMKRVHAGEAAGPTAANAPVRRSLQAVDGSIDRIDV
jgi:hypothetical protein